MMVQQESLKPFTWYIKDISRVTHYHAVVHKYTRQFALNFNVQLLLTFMNTAVVHDMDVYIVVGMEFILWLLFSFQNEKLVDTIQARDDG